jgi:LysM repeat protein
MSKLCNAILLTIVPAVIAAQTLRGSRASVDLMYASAQAKDLAFLASRSDLYEAVGLGELELISITNDVTLDRAKFPFVLPNTRKFVDSLAAAYHGGCGERLAVTSGARPIDEQPRNASPKSVHPTGMAVDFHKPRGACLTWLRTNLLALEDAHVIEATEERHPPHFHVAVLRQLPERPRSALANATSSLPTDTGSKAKIAAGDILPTVGQSTMASAATAGGTVPPVHSTATSLPTKRAAIAAEEKKAASGTYRVKAGDNLWTIARRRGTTPEAIQRLNGLATTRLRVGQRLKLP